MPIVQTKVDKTAAGGDAYLAAPDVDLSGKFTPDYYLVRSDASNAVEVVLSFDGVTDGVTMPLVANNGGIYQRLDTHALKVWVKRVGAGAGIAFISACTRA